MSFLPFCVAQRYALPPFRLRHPPFAIVASTFAILAMVDLTADMPDYGGQTMAGCGGILPPLKREKGERKKGNYSPGEREAQRNPMLLL